MKCLITSFPAAVVGLIVLTSHVSAHKTPFDMLSYDTHDCTRDCVPGAEPMVCKYHFFLEVYWTLSRACYGCPFNQEECFKVHCAPTDGVPRGIRTANRKLPGPSIQVCKGDTVEVTVKNWMEASEGTSIHWHGMLQRGSQYMDGASLVTQCPISSRSSFTYSFKADNPGTHFWHANAGSQQSDGLFGSLIVRRPGSEEPQVRQLYDHDLPEHVIIVNDWLKELSVNRFAARHHDDGDTQPMMMLINGHGRRESFTHENGTVFYTPYAKFMVRVGMKYRFRVISSAIMDCPIQFSIDEHNLKMIATDGNDITPAEVESFVLYGGERFDFVLEAKKSTLSNYWIRARGLAECSAKKAFQVAVLHYESANDELPAGDPTWENSARGGHLLNPSNEKGSMMHEIYKMDATEPDDDVMRYKPNKIFYLGLDFNSINDNRFHHSHKYPLSKFEGTDKQLYTPQINHISIELPPSPLLTQYGDTASDRFCNESTKDMSFCVRRLCGCVHRLKVSINDIVELVLVDEGTRFTSNHPMHLHGHKFRVMGMDKLNTNISVETIKEMDSKNQLIRKTTKAPLKDTVTVPDGGYTIIRFKADNPGMWFFHSTVDFHLQIGMGLVIQVGGMADFPRKPKNFPECGDWSFKGYEEVDHYTHSQPCGAESVTTSLASIVAVLVALVSRFVFI